MLVFRKSKFSEHIDDLHPSELETMSQPRSTEAYRPIPTNPKSGSWSPPLPHQHPKPSSSTPSTPPPSSTPSHTPTSTPESTLHTPSPPSLPTHPPQPRSTSFIFHSPTHPVPPFLLSTVLHILNGEGAIADLAAVERYRSTLPIYAAYSGLEPDFEWMDSVDESEGKWLDAWLANQQAWEGCENVVLHGEWDKYGGEKSYAEILRGVYGFCEEGGVGGGGLGSGMSGGVEEDRFEYEERHVSDDDVGFGWGGVRGQGEELDGEGGGERRGRSRTRRMATAARREFRDDEVW